MSWQHLNQPQGWIGVISLSLSLSLTLAVLIIDSCWPGLGSILTPLVPFAVFYTVADTLFWDPAAASHAVEGEVVDPGTSARSQRSCLQKLRTCS